MKSLKGNAKGFMKKGQYNIRAQRTQRENFLTPYPAYAIKDPAIKKKLFDNKELSGDVLGKRN